MAITQDRMLALIATARHYESLNRALRRAITSALSAVAQGEPPADVIDNLRIDTLGLTPNEEHIRRLADEEAWFRLRAHDNRRRAERAERQRRDAGVPRRVVKGDSIFEPGELSVYRETRTGGTGDAQDYLGVPAFPLDKIRAAIREVDENEPPVRPRGADPNLLFTVTPSAPEKFETEDAGSAPRDADGVPLPAPKAR